MPKKTRIRVVAVTILLSVSVAVLSSVSALALLTPETTVSAVLTTSNLKSQLAEQPALTMGTRAPKGQIIHVNEKVRYQRIKGVGAAMTDTSGWLIHQLPAATRSQVLGKLFGAAGLHLNFLRVPIGASDFTAKEKPYSYDDRPAGRADFNLTHFSTGHDNAYILPTLRAALAKNPKTFVFADPWTAPAWMKTNGSLGNVGDAGLLHGTAYKAFANYFVKFLREYAKHGVRIDAIAPANEPGNPTPYPGMNVDEQQEASFVTNDLVPSLKAARLRPQIYGYDYGWSSYSIPFAQSLAKSSAARALTGIATHCYYGPPTVMSALHQRNSRLDEVVSECSPGITPFPTSEVLISAMRNWASAVALWNLALNQGGGPVQPPNRGCLRCTGLVTINPASGTGSFSIDAYQLGQLARYVTPGARRIASENFVSYRYLKPGTNIASSGLDDVAFQNPNGSKALLAYNNSTRSTHFSVESDKRYFSYTLPAHATATFVWDQPLSQ